ncbi:unnamed protein product [Malus baccata var. baccata]
MKAFSMLLKLKDFNTFEWRADHQEAFTHIKVSLTTPPVLVPPRRSQPFKLYILATEKSIGCLLAQDNDVGHYMLSSVTQVIAQTDVIRYMLPRPIVKGQLVLAGVGIVIQSPTHNRWYFSLKLDFECTNNQAEYEALVIGFGVLHDLQATRVIVLGDFELVINKLNGVFRCMSCTLTPYNMVASYLAESFDDVTFKHISRVHNTDADELAQIAFGA